LIPDPAKWLSAIRTAASHAADSGRLTCIGVTPDSPESRFGYMVAGSRLPSPEGEVYAVERFVEKPPLETLQQLIRSTHLLRNIGVLVAPVQQLLAEIAQHLPEVATVLNRSIIDDPAKLRGAYESLASVSIDHGVLQSSDNVSVVHADVSRIDVGDLGSLAHILDLDDDKNAVEGRCISLNSKDNIVLSGNATVALVGVDNLIVIVQDDTILVCDRRRTQEIKNVQDAINARENG
jgi:mannose-1-phosphate guanylyltransferase